STHAILREEIRNASGDLLEVLEAESGVPAGVLLAKISMDASRSEADHRFRRDRASFARSRRMKLRHPLHEFMPYGAPDLLVAHRPDLSRALTLAAFAAF